LRNPGLARTDEPIARLGAKNFYRGLDVYSMGPTGRRRCTCIWRRRASLRLS